MKRTGFYYLYTETSTIT